MSPSHWRKKAQCDPGAVPVLGGEVTPLLPRHTGPSGPLCAWCWGGGRPPHLASPCPITPSSWAAALFCTVCSFCVCVCPRSLPSFFFHISLSHTPSFAPLVLVFPCRPPSFPLLSPCILTLSAPFPSSVRSLLIPLFFFLCVLCVSVCVLCMFPAMLSRSSPPPSFAPALAHPSPSHRARVW